MTRLSLVPYGDPAKHARISEIIRQRSSNPADMREFFFKDVALSKAQLVLELGCGFGFSGEAIAARMPIGGTLVGVDANPKNRTPFCLAIEKTGRKCEFVQMTINDRLPWPERTFDGIVCGFALYFFVDVLPHIRRVLKPEGQFVAITHSHYAYSGFAEMAGVDVDKAILPSVTRPFSRQNGGQLLGAHFAHVHRRDYDNVLVFEPEHMEDLLFFTQHKLPFLIPGHYRNRKHWKTIESRLEEVMQKNGAVHINKGDSCFYCSVPILGNGE